MKNLTNNSIFINYQECSFTNGMIKYFGTLIFFIGIISTGLSICVFARKQLRKNLFLFETFLFFCFKDENHVASIS